MDKAISIFNPAQGVECADFSRFNSQDVKDFDYAHAHACAVLQSIKELRALLVEQGGKGRAFKLAELLHAERLVSAYIYPIELIQGEFASRKGGV